MSRGEDSPSRQKAKSQPTLPNLLTFLCRREAAPHPEFQPEGVWMWRAAAHPRWTHGNKKSTFVDGEHQDSGLLFTAAANLPCFRLRERDESSLRGLGGQSCPVRASSVPSFSLAGSPMVFSQSCRSSPLHSPQAFSASSSLQFLEDGYVFSFSVAILGHWIWSPICYPPPIHLWISLSPIFPLLPPLKSFVQSQPYISVPLHL